MNTNKPYLGLLITGVGFIRQARMISRSNKKLWTVDIVALRGDTSDMKTTKFDCLAPGHSMQRVILQLEPYIQDKRRVFVSFELTDLYPETFRYERGPKAGKTGVNLKAELLKIHWAKVDGQLVYTAPNESDEPFAQAA